MLRVAVLPPSILVITEEGVVIFLNTTEYH